MKYEHLKEIFVHFGAATQLKKLAEEISEYLQAYFKADMEKMLDEMADIKVIVDQFYIEFDSMNKEYYRKILRTKERIKDGYYK